MSLAAALTGVLSASPIPHDWEQRLQRRADRDEQLRARAQYLSWSVALPEVSDADRWPIDAAECYRRQRECFARSQQIDFLRNVFGERLESSELWEAQKYWNRAWKFYRYMGFLKEHVEAHRGGQDPTYIRAYNARAMLAYLDAQIDDDWGPGFAMMGWLPPTCGGMPD